MKRLFLILLVLTVNTLGAQNIHPDILSKAWKAYWITVPEEMVSDYGVYRFRKTVSLAQKPDTYIVHVSADNRYKLMVNGHLVSVGPALGNIQNWNFETVDIAGYLTAGDNTIAAIVWDEGRLRPVMQFSVMPAFILQGNTKNEFDVNTNGSWQCNKMLAYAPLAQNVPGYYALGPGESVDMNLSDFDWSDGRQGRDEWKNPIMLGVGMPKGSSSLLPSGQWMLVPSSIPQMEMTAGRIMKTRRTEGITVPASFPKVGSDITVPANTQVSILLDQTWLTNAYPTIIYSNGKDASVALRYAEALYDARKKKGNRDEIEGKTLIGRMDSIVCNGGQRQNYTTLTWRTFRYLQLDIRTGDEPLVIHDIYSTFTGYPFENNSTFTSDKPILEDILGTGWRTARLCAVETYFDCPYYEQLQYIGDTRIQSLVSYYNSGDDRLARKAIDMMDASRFPEGITQSRYPATIVQIIPPYSLFWIGMLHDYYRYRPDEDFVRSKLPGMRQVLGFFARYQQEDGSLKDSPYWNFTDWVEGGSRSWKFGTPPLDGNGESAVLDLQLLWAYQLAAELEESLGEPYFAGIYARQAQLLQETIVTKYWDADRGMFADNAEKRVFSQHANSLAILTGIAPAGQAPDIYRRITTGDGIVGASIYFQYYLNQALWKAGLGDDYLNRLGIWEKYLELGMTTWGEDSNVEGTRSDCHAWGSSPNIEFFRIVLGIDSDAPGFSKVKIEPYLGTLTKAEGSIPHPAGSIRVKYALEKKKWHMEISLPEGIWGTFIWEGNDFEIHPGQNRFVI